MGVFVEEKLLSKIMWGLILKGMYNFPMPIDNGVGMYVIPNEAISFFQLCITFQKHFISYTYTVTLSQEIQHKESFLQIVVRVNSKIVGSACS